MNQRAWVLLAFTVLFAIATLLAATGNAIDGRDRITDIFGLWKWPVAAIICGVLFAREIKA